MKTLVVIALAMLMQACSVNIVVAPHAVLAIDSDAAQGDTVHVLP